MGTGCTIADGGGYGPDASAAAGTITRKKWSKGVGKGQPSGLPPLRPPSPPPLLDLSPEAFTSSSVVAKMASEYWRTEKRTPRCNDGNGASAPSTRAVTASSLASESTEAGMSAVSTPSAVGPCVITVFRNA